MPTASQVVPSGIGWSTRVNRKIRQCLAPALALALPLACNKPNDSTAGGPTQLSSRKNAYIADVPVPSDFVLNENRSVSRVFNNIRIVSYEYYGPGSAMAVRNFYVTQMPSNQWQAMAETLDEGAYTLRYAKGGEYCEVRIRHGGTGSLFRPIQIKVIIEPHQESGAKAP